MADSFIMPGHWASAWHHQLVDSLEPWLHDEMARRSINEVYEKVAEHFARLDKLVDPRTGAVIRMPEISELRSTEYEEDKETDQEWKELSGIKVMSIVRYFRGRSADLRKSIPEPAFRDVVDEALQVLDYASDRLQDVFAPLPEADGDENDDGDKSKRKRKMMQAGIQDRVIKPKRRASPKKDSDASTPMASDSERYNTQEDEEMAP